MSCKTSTLAVACAEGASVPKGPLCRRGLCARRRENLGVPEAIDVPLCPKEPVAPPVGGGGDGGDGSRQRLPLARHRTVKARVPPSEDPPVHARLPGAIARRGDRCADQAGTKGIARPARSEQVPR